MDIRQLQYLAALAREKHFTRAAAACNVTQPTLSGRIRQLELSLGVPIVERGQRYQGFTAEGEKVLKWAHVILSDWQSMLRELKQLSNQEGGLTGRLVLGAIPSALPMLPLLTKEIWKLHPNVEFTIQSFSTEQIIRSLTDFSADVGVGYLDNEPLNGFLTTPLYTERYCLFVSDDHALAARENVTWREAAENPLSLLTPNMQNRRIIDRAFQMANCRPVPLIETDSVMNLCSNVRVMGLASIMPEYISEVLGLNSGIRALPLVEPKIEHSVGLIIADRDPLSPLIVALRVAAQTLSSKNERA
jgi:DNA-binding transcriptional LysR family regulator